MYKVADEVTQVRAQLASMQTVLKSLSDNQATLTSTVDTIASASAAMVNSAVVISTGDDESVKPIPAAAVSHTVADLLRNQENKAEWFTPSTSKKKSPTTVTAVRKIVGGNKSADLKVKAIASSGEWHIFFGRLDPSTTADELTDMLSANKISVVSCKPLKKNADWHNKYAAFRVVIEATDKDRVFDDTVWPDGADVRDWVFASKRT